MRIVFAGTSEFAIPALKTLINSQHNICAVYTQPDRLAGRGQKLTPSPVKVLALTHKLQVLQPSTLKSPEAQQELRNLNADILVNVAYGMLLPEAILNIPKFGCINIHPSLLPRWRGAAPIQRAILAGDSLTAVTIMKMDIGLDTGDIYKQETVLIENSDTSLTLSNKTAEIGAKLLLEVLSEIEGDTAKAVAQDNTTTTYASKLTKEEGKINWQLSALEIERMVRAFNPWPIAYTELAGNYVRIWEVKIEPNNQPLNSAPGTIVKTDKNGIYITTGNGLLCLQKIQLPGGKPLPTVSILNSNQHPFTVGQQFNP